MILRHDYSRDFCVNELKKYARMKLQSEALQA